MSEFFKFPHTPHLAWLGEGTCRADKVLSPAEAEEFLRCAVLVEEKVDGANVGLSVDPHGRLQVQNRGSYIVPGSSHPQFGSLFGWLAPRKAALADALGTGRILFGEWCWAVHSVRYTDLPDWFLAFDVYDRGEGAFWSAARRDRLVGELDLARVPSVAEGHFQRSELVDLLGTSRLGSEPAEGLYLRREEGEHLAARAKLVRSRFLQATEEHWSKRPMRRNRLAGSSTGGVAGERTHNEVEDWFAQLPQPVQVVQDFRPPNGSQILHEGTIQLRSSEDDTPVPGLELELDGQMALHWLPRPCVRFHGRSEDDRNGSCLGACSLGLSGGSSGLPDGGQEVPALVLRQAMDDPGWRFEGVTNGPVLLGEAEPVDELCFSLVNFPEYLGESVRVESQGWRGGRRARLAFDSDDWSLAVDQVRDIGDRLQCVAAQGGYATTHACRMTRREGAVISFGEASGLLERLRFFFGFLAGKWCGPVLSTGNRTGSRLWSVYGPWILSTERSGRSWLPHQRATEMSSILQGFMTRDRCELWSDPVRTAIHWLISANAETRTTEAAITSSFIPLELLAWLVVVEDGDGTVSEKDFADNTKWSTEKRVSRLLEETGIPIEIPDHLEALQASALAKEMKTGPGCLTRVRNALVHPKRCKRTFLSTLDGTTKHELRELALGYIELVLLRKFGYHGSYARRGFRGWEGGDLAVVPWGTAARVPERSISRPISSSSGRAW